MDAPALTIWKNSLFKIQLLIIALYAIAISLPITYAWVLLTIGLVVWVAQFVLDVCVKAKLSKCTFMNAAAQEFRVPPLTVPIAIFVVCATISGAVNGGAKEAFASLLSFRAFLVYFWAYQLFRDNLQMRIIAVQCALLMGALGGIWGTIQQVANIHPTEYKYLQGTGFMFSPMPFSGVMQILGCLALGLLLYRENSCRYFLGMDAVANRAAKVVSKFDLKISMSRLLYAPVAVCNVLGVVFASERSGWLGAVAGIAVVLACTSMKVFVRGALLFATLAVIAWFTVPVFHQRLEPLLDWRQDVSARVRVQIWGKAIELFREKPVFGVGIRNFPRLEIKEALVAGPNQNSYLDHAHSNYFHILATTGAVGLLSYLYLCGAILMLAAKSLYSKSALPFDRGVALGLLGAMVSLVVAGFFEYNFGNGQVRLAQWFVLALLCVNRIAEVNQSSETSKAI